MTSSCAAGWETPQRTDSTACECAKLSRAGGLRGTTELQHTYVLTSHKPGIYSPAPNTNATMDTADSWSLLVRFRPESLLVNLGPVFLALLLDLVEQLAQVAPAEALEI